MQEKKFSCILQICGVAPQYQPLLIVELRNINLPCFDVVKFSELLIRYRYVENFSKEENRSKTAQIKRL
jgi:hypothetical protein